MDHTKCNKLESAPCGDAIPRQSGVGIISGTERNGEMHCDWLERNPNPNPMPNPTLTLTPTLTLP